MLKRNLFRVLYRVLIGLGVLLVSTERPAHAQIVAGTITALNGSATITRGARNFPATYSAPVDVADELKTSPSGRLTVTLTDNSQLELTESSTLLISEDLLNPNGTRARTSLTLMGGLMRSLVRVTAGTSPNYEVHTPNAVASARGTTYDTYYTNNTHRPGFPNCKEFTDVLDYDGVVEVRSVTNPTSPAIELHSGQKTTVPCGLALLPASSLAALSTGSAAGGLSTATIAAASAGSFAAVTGGVVGGVAGAGGFSSSSTPTPAPKKPITPTM